MLVKLAAIFFSMILVNNYVLVKFYGICPFLGVSKKLDSAVGMSGAVIFVMFMATAVTFPIQIFILDPAGLSYLQTIVFILVIAVQVQINEIILNGLTTISTDFRQMGVLVARMILEKSLSKVKCDFQMIRRNTF